MITFNNVSKGIHKCIVLVYSYLHKHMCLYNKLKHVYMYNLCVPYTSTEQYT